MKHIHHPVAYNAKMMHSSSEGQLQFKIIPGGIRISDPISQETADAVGQYVDKLIETTYPLLYVEMESPGGSVDAGRSIIQHFKRYVNAGKVDDTQSDQRHNLEGAEINFTGSKHIIATYIPVHAQSMACYIAAHGTPGFRFMAPSAKSLVHSVRFSQTSVDKKVTVQNLQWEASGLVSDNESLLDQLGYQTNHPKGYWRNLVNSTLHAQDTHIGSIGALDFNLVDGIGKPIIKIDLNPVISISTPAVIRNSDDIQECIKDRSDPRHDNAILAKSASQDSNGKMRLFPQAPSITSEEQNKIRYKLKEMQRSEYDAQYFIPCNPKKASM